MHEQWEYVHVQFASTNTASMMRALNDAGARGWDLVTVTDNDPTVGINSLLAVLKRRVVPLDLPDDLTADWKSDPSGRFESRYWDGEAWTMRVATAGAEHRDPPTARTPADLPQ